VKRLAIAAVVLCALRLAGTSARADDAPPRRPWHGSVGAGGAFVLLGERGDRQRADVAFDVKPRSRFGILAAWRAFDEDHDGLVMAGVVYEGGAARPRIVLDLHAEVGVDLDEKAPLAGGGIRTTLTIIGPLGVALDSGAYLVIDGVDNSRLHFQSNALVVARW
jgi:hypothetical protein